LKGGDAGKVLATVARLGGGITWSISGISGAARIVTSIFGPTVGRILCATIVGR
jgi:hypothetical protein